VDLSSKCTNSIDLFHKSRTFFLYNSTNLPHMWISVPNEQICIDLFHKVTLSSCTVPQI
jgi:hypothetical protein